MSVVGRYTTTAAAGAAIAAGLSSVAADPAHPDDASTIARSAAAAFAVPDEDAVDVDTSGIAELRASRSAVRRPVTSPQPPAAPVAPAADPVPPAAAPAPTPSTQPAPTSTFTTSTARTGAAVESGLTANAMKVLNAVRAAYPQLSSFGGARSERGSDHATGQAIDFMIPSYSSASGRALGDALAAFVQSHAAELSVDYVIWRQRIWSPGRGGWRGMSDRGDATANHFDHVHVSVR